MNEITTRDEGVDKQDIGQITRSIIAENNLTKGLDMELLMLTRNSLEIMYDKDFDRFLKAQEPFRGGKVTVIDEDRNKNVVYYYNLRESLRKLPKYFTAAQKSGLSYEQSNDLLIHLLKSIKYPEISEEYKDIMLLGRAFDCATETGLNLATEVKKIEEIITVSSDESIISGNLYSFGNATRIGLNVEQSLRLLRRLPEESSIAGYPIMSFNDALKTLMFANVDPELVVETFNVLGGKNPYFQQQDYKIFQEMVAFSTTLHDITVNELLQTIVDNKNEKSPLKKVLEHIQKIPQTGLDREPTKYFTEKKGKLELSTVPYRIQRSLNEGMRDLEKIARANSLKNWDEVGEGHWIYAPETEIWYSMGGVLEISRGRIRHNIAPYEVSRLSKNPWFFHVHGEELEIMISPGRKSIPQESLRKIMTKYTSAIPSRGDYGILASYMKDAKRHITMRAFIVHGQGVTEYIFPDDVAQLEKMSKNSRDISDEAVKGLLYEPEPGVFVYDGHGMPSVDDILLRQNKLLPEGFSIDLHSEGYNPMEIKVSHKQ